MENNYSTNNYICAQPLHHLSCCIKIGEVWVELQVKNGKKCFRIVHIYVWNVMQNVTECDILI